MSIRFQAAWRSCKRLASNSKLSPSDDVQLLAIWFQAAWTSSKLISSNSKLIPGNEVISNNVNMISSSLNKFQANFKQFEIGSKQRLNFKQCQDIFKQLGQVPSWFQAMWYWFQAPVEFQTMSIWFQEAWTSSKLVSSSSKLIWTNGFISIEVKMIPSSLYNFQAKFKQFEIDVWQQLDFKQCQDDSKRLEQAPS